MSARQFCLEDRGVTVDVKPLILFVDDEEDLCMLMQMTLSRMGIDSHIANGVTQAKQLLQQHQYDACLTDLNMPDGSGLQLVSYISHTTSPLRP